MSDKSITMKKLGLLLVGHGTRNVQGVGEFLETAKLVARLVPDVAVEAGFLELAEPTIGTALKRLTDAGAREIVVAPLLLFEAGHAKEDIPKEVATAATGLPRIVVWQAKPLGCHEKILAASAKRFQSVLPPGENEPWADVAWLSVSRGTSDRAALAEVERFVQLRRALTPVPQTTIAYMSVAQPTVDAALDAIARSSYSRVVVQPHLLFQGKLTSELRTKVALKRKEFPEKQWFLADHLGPCTLVAEALVERFRKAREAADPPVNSEINEP